MDAKDEKKKQTCLRFMVGDVVYFKRNDMTGWHAGKVEELWYRPVSKKPSCPYRVRQLSPPIQEGQSPGEMMVEIERDTDSYIRHNCFQIRPQKYLFLSVMLNFQNRKIHWTIFIGVVFSRPVLRWSTEWRMEKEAMIPNM
jgi:hypothetical protein